MDIDLLALTTTREVHERIRPHVNEETLSKEAQTIYNVIDNWYKSFPLFNSFTWEELETHFFITKDKSLPKGSHGVYKTIFKNLSTYTTTATRDELFKHYINQEYVARITEVLHGVTEGKKTLDDVETLVEQHKVEFSKATGTTNIFVGDDITEVVSASSAPGLEWRLEELNISCGPLRQGDFVIVAARPEVGKTTFLADNVSYMASQIKDKRPVLWINNEERSGKVMFRVMQAALGWTTKDIEDNPTKAMAEYQKMMGMSNRILIIKNDSGLNSVRSLVPLFKAHNPALIIFDQLDKVAGVPGSKDERDDLRLGRVYLWARELSHTYGPVIAASQADASAEGLMWLEQDKLRGSKTDKPGEADAIITIGRSLEAGMEMKRGIYVPKNKLHGGARSVEKERHGKWEVEIAPEIARYVGTK